MVSWTSKGPSFRDPISYSRTILIAMLIVLILWMATAVLEKAHSSETIDNPQYREWCEETFVNGDFIYEAYKDIAFNITCVPETNKIDHWQTPAETTRLTTGDCEDAVFLFHAHLPPDQASASIIWGWIIDSRDTAPRAPAIATAHVWYQLADKKGRQYIVEAFSGDWEGITPIDEETRTRTTILEIPHSFIRSTGTVPPAQKSLWLGEPRAPTAPYFGYEYIANPSNITGRGVDREISNIFEKLFELFSRDSYQVANNE